MHPTTRLRRAGPADAEGLTDLHLDCWDDAYTGLVPQALIDGRRAERAARVKSWAGYVVVNPTWVAEDETGLVGFATSGAPRDPAWDGAPLELMSLYTRARVWGTGVGQALLREAVGERPAYLWVLRANDRAVRFYERQTFALDGAERTTAAGLEARMVRG